MQSFLGTLDTRGGKELKQAPDFRGGQRGSQPAPYLGDHFAKCEDGNRVASERLPKRSVILPCGLVMSDNLTVKLPAVAA